MGSRIEWATKGLVLECALGWRSWQASCEITFLGTWGRNQTTEGWRVSGKWAKGASEDGYLWKVGRKGAQGFRLCIYLDRTDFICGKGRIFQRQEGISDGTVSQQEKKVHCWCFVCISLYNLFEDELFIVLSRTIHSKALIDKAVSGNQYESYIEKTKIPAFSLQKCLCIFTSAFLPFNVSGRHQRSPF